MRVALNVTALLSPRTGIGEYSYQLARSLRSISEIELEFFYGAFWTKQLIHGSSQSFAAAGLPWLRKHLPYSYELRRWLQNSRFAHYAKKAQFDVYHEPNILPLRFEGPTVVTVHDLSWIRFPETHPVERVRAMNRHFEVGLRQASAVITDSEWVRQEVLEIFGLAPSAITAIPLGVDSIFEPRDAAQTRVPVAQQGLKHGNYLLAVGTLEPRKNLSTALRAYQQLPSRLRERYPLVLIGMRGWHTSAVERQMAPLIHAGQVRLLGYVSRSDLVSLMSGARALVYPSLYEGFGLPPLEAMACGTPVICSSGSSLPEVVGDAGISVESLDHVALMGAMQCLLEDDNTWMELRRKSLMRARRFSWDSCAAKTADVYRSVAK